MNYIKLYESIIQRGKIEERQKEKIFIMRATTLNQSV